MKKLILLFLMIPAVGLAASSNQVNKITTVKDYEAEWMMSLYSLENTSASLIGGSVSKAYTKDMSFGLRAQLPFIGNDGINIFSLHAFSRYYFKKSSTSYFGELGFGANGLTGATYRNFVSAGFAIGFNYKVSEMIRVGGLFGNEIATEYFKDGGNSFPKVALLSTFIF